MLYSEVAMGHQNVVNILELLEQDENNKVIADICIKESKRLHNNLINLEELCEFVINNNINFDYLLNEIAYINDVSINSIGFTVYPSTLYENKLIYEFVNELQEEGKDIYIISEPRNNISYAFDLIIKECIDTESTVPFEYIAYECFNETENMSQEIIDNVKDKSEYVINKAKNLINNTMKSGKNASKQLINKLDSTINSLKKQVRINPNKSTIITDLINKTTELKNKILSKVKSKFE